MDAIELCSMDENYVGSLIDIANKNKLHNKINIQAAIKFYEIVKENSDEYEIHEAVKKLNIRWLKNALDIVLEKLNDIEIKKVNELFNFIEKAKTSV